MEDQIFRKARIKKYQNWLIPALVFLFLFSISYIFILTFNHSEEDVLNAETEITGQQVKLRLESWIDSRISMVAHIAHNWSGISEIDSEEYTKEATELLALLPGLQALNFIDKYWIISIVVPEEGNEPALGKDLHYHPNKDVAETIARVEQNQIISRSDIIDLLQGGKGFATYLPVHDDKGQLNGFINGVFRIDDLIHSCLTEPGLRENFYIAFEENELLIESGGDLEELKNNKFLNTAALRVVDKPWTLSIAPTSRYISERHNFLPIWIYFISLALSGYIAYLVRLVIRRRELMRLSENKFARVIEHAGDAYYLINPEGIILDVNSAACQQSGYDRDELLSKRFQDIDKNNAFQSMSEFILSLKPETNRIIETEHIRKDHSLIPVDIRVGLINIEGSMHILCLSRDVSEQRRLKNLEVRAQRLESAGKISGQIAHDFNNLLAPLIAYPELIREELSLKHPALPYLDLMEKSATRIAEINQQLLTLGRRGHYNLEILNLNRVVSEAVKEIGLTIDSFNCKIDIDKNLINIKGGSSQIHRVILNLLHNAYDATLEKGRVTIKTENYYLNELSIAYVRIPAGEYVKLTISDTGQGIPADIIQNIFDPFFSTKTTNSKRGSGLGLSVVDAVMRDHNGYLDLKSEVGKGTSFFLYFPVTRESAREKSNADFPGGSESILIIDDDEIQREVTGKLLKNLGYEVSTVENGEEAIRFIKEKPQDILILDMIMPFGLDGVETYRQILELNSSQKAIIVSGFSESAKVKEVQMLGAGEFVKKPVTRKIIAEAVRTELDKPISVKTS